MCDRTIYDNNSTKAERGGIEVYVLRFLDYMQNGIILLESRFW